MILLKCSALRAPRRWALGVKPRLTAGCEADGRLNGLPYPYRVERLQLTGPCGDGGAGIDGCPGEGGELGGEKKGLFARDGEHGPDCCHGKCLVARGMMVTGKRDARVGRMRVRR